MKISPEGPYSLGHEPCASDELQEAAEKDTTVTDMAEFKNRRVLREIAKRACLFEQADTDPWPDGA